MPPIDARVEAPWRKHLGSVKATWIAELADRPWLYSERGKVARPAELAIRTSATVAIFGDNPDLYAARLDSSAIKSGLPETIGMAVEATANDLMPDCV